MMHTTSSERSRRNAVRWSRLTRHFSLVFLGLLIVASIPLAPGAHAAPSKPRNTPHTPQPRKQGVQAQSTVPFTPTACPIPPTEGIQLDCGYLTVAESRRNYTGKTIRLAVAILRSPNPTPAKDPIVFLQGGPGGPTVMLAPMLAEVYAPLLAERDIILMDQRGTGFSQPALNCGIEMQTINSTFPLGDGDRPAMLQYMVDVLKACGGAYREAGIDLRAYNTVENAADLEDLRRALGYGQWNLVGGSYGTRLALTAMQYRPETIRSAVLDSVYPLQANFHTDVFGSYQRALDRLFADCAADPACNRAYPNLAASFDTIIARLNAEPAQIPLRDIQTGELITYIPITGVDTAAIFFQLFYITPVIPVLPLFIDQTAKGNYEPLSEIISLLVSGSGGLSLGMQIAVQCNEDATFASARDFVAARDRFRRASPLAHDVRFNEAMLEVCQAWGLTNPDPAENRPVRSSVPSLLIAGTYDPITPPQYAHQAAATLANSTVVEYPRGGHGPSIGSPCLTGMIGEFLNNPAARPNSACIAQEASQPFVVPQGNTGALKLRSSIKQLALPRVW
jgi:pimeloyl-ACP methyl ester carboxylesterase